MLLTIEKVIILKSINLFSEISENDLLAVAMQLQELEYDENSVVFNQGDLGTSLYIIVRGEVEVIINEQVISILGEKNIFGELAALDPEPRSATIKTTKNSLLFRLESIVMYNLIAEYGDVARGIIKILCQRIRQSNS
ncbi:protein containing cyclic nucleotide-binding domain [Sulfurimonas gotlandica GD1]|jgi:CRP/FNR family cyclic AMP-dependent transcriptional regulator|uniref:Protein containing cyclic nucleotide-binding domain n=1 Tax=Sulfurimonas gotlandica (strain DSM 19862 / JCM 16533 / GD1) TaxID=929558 RepID=B6BHK1_SULGG|nr:cyclic nucleotide-binding domain-containing protein [Sulfurimonas gotlandica]EDZ63660.1 cyclic nucleotide-binding protein, putative [Sulfurimonas gotlandica GD1]EHP29999.1 protein containing cyclic nucleotide-binding domain [Sulfurimonas gotlandica GD1]